MANQEGPVAIKNRSLHCVQARRTVIGRPDGLVAYSKAVRSATGAAVEDGEGADVEAKAIQVAVEASPFRQTFVSTASRCQARLPSGSV